MPSRFSRILKRLVGAGSAPERAASARSDPDPAMKRDVRETPFNGFKAEADQASFAGLYRHLSRKDDGPRRGEAYALLRKILTGASAHDLCRLEALCREGARAEWAGEKTEARSAERATDWAGFPPDGFCPDGTASDERLWGYALASFHPNGFLREKAVIGLASIGTGEEIPFLLLRLRDWVEQVRVQAESAMDARLRNADGDAPRRLLRALPIAERVRASERRPHVTLLSRLGKRIASDRDALLSGLGSADMETRRFCFDSALGTEGIGPETVREALLREPQGSLRLYALRSMAARPGFPRDDGFIGRLLRDPFPPVRRLALDIRCKRALGGSGEVLREAALSVDAGVRHTARFHMNAAGREEPVALYRKVLAGGNGNALVGALLGLGEVGERQDAELLHPFLRHGRAAVVRAAIRSLGSLQAGFLATLLTPFVSDPRPGVSREAALALKTRTSGLNPEKLDAVRKSAALPHVRKHILMLLFAIGSWESLPYILEALANAKAGGSSGGSGGGAGGRAGERAGERAEERKLAEKALARWLLRSNSHFVEPDLGSKERCAESLARYGSALGERSRKALAYILR